MKCTFDITGDKELMAKLDSLPNKIEKRVIRQAARVTQKLLVPVVRANANSMVGGKMGALLAKTVQVRAAKKQRKGQYTILVLHKKGVPEFVSTTKSDKRHYIPAAVAYGHLVGDTYVQPIPYFQAAADATTSRRMQVFKEQLRIGLLREAIKGRG